MESFDELWTWYGRTPHPANIGDRAAGVALAEIDDEEQDIASYHAGRRMDAAVRAGDDAYHARRMARLGLALADLVQVLPVIQPAATQAYFERVATLARAVLADVARES
ncbi:hypothetical protein [Roseisolibacter sp. H3M3-2]|uniref:hypothetical protein n=1 Tax=Roseisolibacter sp. H3M3-2 TaxID=3031323 RepID=UPI0023DC2091|nr:hypothetical protein [Roseisolibacter sp. H3M3-2]MDF1501784.1 hypothetical protein [Roseisolibacter sp. H3M3-2]